MPIDYQTLKSRQFAPVTKTYTEKDSILYALGVGLSADPLDETDLRYTWEEADGFTALPTMPVVLGSPGFWAREPDTGLTWQKILHGEQGMELHAPVPPAATVTAQNRITEIIDKGEKGALIYLEREISADGVKIATLTSTTFARADGGFGGPTGPVKPVHQVPDRAPDLAVDAPMVRQSALIYRLSGDPNPLHASPAVAKAAGFKEPILHGLCSFGVAGWAILKHCCAGDAARLKSFQLRFSAPVYPGETIQTQIWQDGQDISFRALVGDRVVLNNGHARIA